MEDDSERAWRIIDSEVVIDSPHLRLRRDRIELPGGKEIGPYYVRESRGFSVIFAVTPDEKIVLVRQYKHGISAITLELPAGAIDPGEAPEVCARRELAEETGYTTTPEKLELAGAFTFDPTGSTTRFYLYIAHDATLTGPQHLDDTEQIDVELVTFDQLRAYVRDQTIDIGTHVSSIYYVLDRLKKL